MNIKKSNVITAVICAATLSVASFYFGYAADTNSGIKYNSQGKIIFDNSTEDIVDDVVFDATDFLTIDSMVTDGKMSLVKELNEYDNIELGEDIPEFSTLAASIGSISDGTDAAAGNILSGKKALVGKKIIIGSMANHSGSSTSTSQVKENGTLAEITIPDGYYDGSSKITVPIEVLKKLPTINSDINANAAVGTLARGVINVNVGEIWYIGRNVCGRGYVYCGTDTGYTSDTNPTCQWAVLEQSGSGDNNSTLVLKVQITVAGRMGIANSWAIRLK